VYIIFLFCRVDRLLLKKQWKIYNKNAIAVYC